MFEAAELGRTMSKKDYNEQEPFLRVGLLTVQYELRDADFPVILVLGGTDLPGCTELSNVFHEWMDPRYLAANVYEDHTQEEAERPRFWRYWRTLPGRGNVGLYLREWTSRAIVDHVVGDIGGVELDRRVQHIQVFEKALADDGALILKFWLHMPKKALKKRLKNARKNPGRIVEEDRIILEHYGDVCDVSERVLRQTSREEALWNVIESTDSRYRNATAAKLVIQSLTKRLATPPKTRAAPQPLTGPSPITVLDRVDLTQKLEKDAYEKKLHRYWRKLAKLSEKAH